MSRVEIGDWTVCSAGEGGGSSPEMLQTLQSSKKLHNDRFSKLFRKGFPGTSLWAALGLSLLCSPLTRVLRRT